MHLRLFNPLPLIFWTHTYAFVWCGTGATTKIGSLLILRSTLIQKALDLIITSCIVIIQFIWLFMLPLINYSDSDLGNQFITLRVFNLVYSRCFFPFLVLQVLDRIFPSNIFTFGNIFILWRYFIGFSSYRVFL